MPSPATGTVVVDRLIVRGASRESPAETAAAAPINYRIPVYSSNPIIDFIGSISLTKSLRIRPIMSSSPTKR